MNAPDLASRIVIHASPYRPPSAISAPSGLVLVEGPWRTILQSNALVKLSRTSIALLLRVVSDIPAPQVISPGWPTKSLLNEVISLPSLTFQTRTAASAQE